MQALLDKQDSHVVIDNLLAYRTDLCGRRGLQYTKDVAQRWLTDLVRVEG